MKRRYWTQDELDYLASHVGESFERIGAALGRSPRSVEAKYERMKPSVEKHPQRWWTQKEENYLSRNYLHMSAADVGKQLGRSEASVKHKMIQMRLSVNGSGFLSFTELTRCFHCSQNVIMRWYRDYGMPARKEIHGNSVYYLVEPVDFWRWADTHRELIPWDRYERLSILPEPDFLKNAQIPVVKPARHRAHISHREACSIQRDYFLKGMPYSEIEKKYERTHDSIRHIMRMELKASETKRGNQKKFFSVVS